MKKLSKLERRNSRRQLFTKQKNFLAMTIASIKTLRNRKSKMVNLKS
jgi:hypothetical protein